MRKSAGFPLIELAIVVAIIGFLSVGFLKAIDSLRVQTGRTDTELSLREAQDALRRFYVENRRLPCPAGFTLPATDPDYGREAITGTGCDGGIVRAIPGILNTQSYGGILPIRDLNLSGDRATDGWERQISYQVVAGAVRQAVVSGVRINDPWIPTNQVFTDSTPGTPVHPGAVVILMSHGPNGNSAATVDGGVLQPPPATALNEAENVDPDQDFVDAAVSDDAATPYDDILIALSEAEFFAPLVAAQTAEDRTFTARKLVQRFTDALLIAALRSTAPDPDGQPIPTFCDCTNRFVSDLDYTNNCDPLALPGFEGKCATACDRDASTPWVLGDPSTIEPPLVADDLLTPLDERFAPGCDRTTPHALPWPSDPLSAGVPVIPPVVVPDDVQTGLIPWDEIGLTAATSVQLIDPWGEFLNYAVQHRVADLPGGIDTGISSRHPTGSDVMIVWSSGPDGVDDSTALINPLLPALHTIACGGDDICEIRDVSEVMKFIVAAGHRVD